MSLNSFLMDETLEPQPEKLEVKAFEDTAPGEAPELREDITLIATLEALAIDLDALESSIRTSGGMSRSIALEAHVVIPTFLTGDYASGFFTEQPTKVGLAYAMESIDEAKTSMATKIKEAFAKLIAWMIEKFKAAKEWFEKRNKDKKAGDNVGLYERWKFVSDDSAIARAQAVLEKNQARYKANEDLSKYIYSDRDKEVQSFVVSNAKSIIEARQEKAIKELGTNKAVLALIENWQEHNKILLLLPQYAKTLSSLISDIRDALRNLGKVADIAGWTERIKTIKFPTNESVPSEKAAFKNAQKFEVFLKAVSSKSYDNAYWDANKAVFSDASARLDLIEAGLTLADVESDEHGSLGKIRSFVYSKLAPAYSFITSVLKDSSDVSAAVVVAVGKTNIHSGEKSLTSTANYQEALALCKTEFGELTEREKFVIKEIIVVAYDDTDFGRGYSAGYNK